jgi:hypothetical protein
MARPETTDPYDTSERTHPERASPSAPSDGGAGGGEAFIDPRRAVGGARDSTSTGTAEHAVQRRAAPDGGAGGGEAFDDLHAHVPTAAYTQRKRATVHPGEQTDDAPRHRQVSENPPMERQTTDAKPTLELSASDSWGRPETLQDHFDRHGSDFECTTEPEYAHRGSEFLQRSQAEGLPTKIDPANGTIRVYDPDTNTLGSYNADGTTRTFYRPDPQRHGYQSNWDYWLDQPGDPPKIL